MKNNNCKTFLKKVAMFGASAITIDSLFSCNKVREQEGIGDLFDCRYSIPNDNVLKINGTLLDEITHDIHHKNWSKKEWGEIFDGIRGVVDACAFQDGHIDYDELDAFFEANKRLADKYGLECWTNAESFDRDMPIKFLPIKFDKLRMKLEAAKRAGYKKAITFEFSHFMSPQSAYLQAGHLYNRYKEYFNIK